MRRSPCSLTPLLLLAATAAAAPPPPPSDCTGPNGLIARSTKELADANSNLTAANTNMSTTTKSLNAALLALVAKEKAADDAVNSAFNASNEAIDENNTATNAWLNAKNNLQNTKNECSAPKPASNCPALIAAAQQNVTSALAALAKTSATAKTAKAAVTAAQAQLKSAQDAYQAANTATLAEIKEMQACPSCLSVQIPCAWFPAQVGKACSRAHSRTCRRRSTRVWRQKRRLWHFTCGSTPTLSLLVCCAASLPRSRTSYSYKSLTPLLLRSRKCKANATSLGTAERGAARVQQHSLCTGSQVRRFADKRELDDLARRASPG